MKDKILSDFAGHRSEIKRWFADQGARPSLIKFATKADFLACVDQPKRLDDIVRARLDRTPSVKVFAEEDETPAPAPAPAPASAVDAAAAVAALQALLQPKVTVDAETVRQIVAEMLPTRNIVINIEQGPKFDFTGRHCHGKLGQLIQLMQLDEPPYLKGPAGSGKSTAAGMAAEAFNLPFYHVGKVDSKYDLIGFVDAGGTYQGTSLYKAYSAGGVFLWDEVDASAPDALTAFLNLIEGTSYEFPCGKVDRHPDFRPLAAGNTSMLGADQQYTGRARQDGAFKDRFTEIEWGYDEDLETALYGKEPAGIVQRLRRRADELKIRHIISPRATRRLAKLLTVYPKDTAIELAVRNGLDAVTWEKLLS